MFKEALQARPPEVRRHRENHDEEGGDGEGGREEVPGVSAAGAAPRDHAHLSMVVPSVSAAFRFAKPNMPFKGSRAPRGFDITLVPLSALPFSHRAISRIQFSVSRAALIQGELRGSQGRGFELRSTRGFEHVTN